MAVACCSSHMVVINNGILVYHHDPPRLTNIRRTKFCLSSSNMNPKSMMISVGDFFTRKGTIVKNNGDRSTT